MLDNFRMNGIKFIKYDPLNKEHFVYLQEFSIDEKKHNYYPGWQDFLSAYINNNANNNEIVYLLKTNENFIGICTVDLDEGARAVIAVGLLSKCNSLLYNQVRGNIVKYLQDNDILDVAEYLKFKEKNELDTWVRKGFKVTPVGNTDYFEIKYLEENKNIRK